MTNINLFRNRPVAVIGAGVMGVGIVQVALLAGHPVQLYDVREGAAAAAVEQLMATLAKLADKGKLTPEDVAAARGRVSVASSLDDLRDAALVIEAIVENLGVKQALMRDLEAIVSHDCVLASNTSSLSITAVARGLEVPGRVVGMHFFNPVPLMRLVEVVSGLATEPAVADAIHMLAADWGKTAVHAKSTPGFIVNRIARPFYAETLALLQEQAATPAVLDACMRGAGFRMGPCELMDLIGHDTNFAVTQSVYEANFFDKRYAPSLVQREMVDGGLLGRKSGRGFYRYPEGSAKTVDGDVEATPLPAVPLVLHGEGPLADLLVARLSAAGLSFTREAPSDERRARHSHAERFVKLAIGDGVLLPTTGMSASEYSFRHAERDVAMFDWPVGPAGAPASTPVVALAYAVATQSSAEFAEQAAGVLRALGWLPQRVKDTPGLVVARTISMLINEASDAVDQGVCAPEGADAAMTLGVNYPAGPFAWLTQFGPLLVATLLRNLDEHYRGERYRTSPRLQAALWSAIEPPPFR